jgi:D-glycero-D-manno-heptose 1,7-bisphosphate phosphatase
MFKGAVFFDRDGTVTIEKNYLDNPDDLELYGGVSHGIKLLNERGIKVVVVTNQSGVARGYFTEERLAEINECLIKLLKRDGAFLDEIYYCPHHPDFGAACDCRKPKPGLLKRAAHDLKIDLGISYLVGDKLLDLELARTVNAKGLLVLTGYGRETRKALKDVAYTPDFIADGLLEAAEWIIKDINARMKDKDGDETSNVSL